MRAVYVPAGGEAVGVARLEVAARTGGGDWRLTVCPTGPGRPRRTPLTDAALRDLVRQWGRAVRQGRGALRVG
jgi:hypothetical protein